MWQQATPLVSVPADAGEMAILDRVGGQGRTKELIILLAAGLKDEAIARRLGISGRTLDRRVQALMRTLSARTRFQAGWQAASRFHVTAGSDAPSTTQPEHPSAAPGVGDGRATDSTDVS